MTQTFITRVLAACALTAAVALSTVPASVHAAATIRHDATPASVVRELVQTVNASNQTGDFSALANVFAAKATLRVSMPTGQTTSFHGLAAITQFYQGLHAKVPTFQWTIMAMHVLAKNVVMTYDQAGPPANRALGNCAHVYVVKQGKVVSYDWVIYH